MSQIKNNKKSIAMLVTNDVINDTRVMKEAIALSNKYNVTIFGCGKAEYIDKDSKIKIIVRQYNFLVKILLKISIKKHMKLSKEAIYNSKKTKDCCILMKLMQFIKSLFIRIIIYLNSRTLLKTVKNSKRKFDIIHAHDLDTLKIGVQLKKIFKAKLIYDSHELWTEMSNINPFVKKKYKKIERKHIKFADAVISVSDSICNQLKERYDLNKIPYLIMNTPEYVNVRSIKKPEFTKIKLLYLGYYLPGRGVEKIIEALSKIPRNVYLYLRVDLDNVKTLETLKKVILQNKVEDRVVLLPFVPQEEIVNEISNYDIGLLPYEPVSLNNLFCLPNKLFQYLAGGVCILANDLPDVRKIITDNKCGFTYKSDNIETLVCLVKCLIQDLNELYRCKLNSRRAYEYKFNWERVESELLKIYKDLEVT